ncbi:MAG TPA: hypothetical protein VF579_02325 [Candidatus Methylomirabilis sp.]
MSRTMPGHRWVELRSLSHAWILLILPCNAAACVGNYFRAEVYRESGWNTWREADYLLRDLREQGRVAFAAVDSSILETAPEDPRGAIVLETEMDRATSPDGEDWGAPSWRWFRPTRAGRWTALETLTKALVRGVRRIEALGFPQIIALVNSRGYFLALAAAVAECGLMDRWTLFRVPAHPRYLGQAVRVIVPVIRHAVEGARMPGGIVGIPALLPALRREAAQYREPLPPRWRPWAEPPRRPIRIRPARPLPPARRVGGGRMH